MKILIANTINKTGNPYTYNLFHGLSKISNNTVSDKFLTLLEIDVHFDIIHIHWPEEIFWKKGTSKKSIDTFINALNKRKERGEKIIFTVHNLTPHKRTDPMLGKDLYCQFLPLVDGFIHLASPSINILNDYYKDDLDTSMFYNTIIPHGDYSLYHTSKTITPITNTVLTMGAIRTLEEYQNLITLSKVLEPFQLKLLVSGKHKFVKPLSIPKKLKYYLSRIQLLNKNITFQKKYVSFDSIQELLQSTKILLIPRIDTLNSGTAYLGLTFNKPMIGPDSGNIGHILKSSGNETYEPNNHSTLRTAIEKILSNFSNYENSSKAYKKTHLNWQSIIKKHQKFYETSTLR